MLKTPKQSTAFKVLIEALTGLSFYDSSYSNDVCDSIMCDKYHLQIFLPNVENPFLSYIDLGNEDYISFAVSIFNSDVDDCPTYIVHDFTIIELVAFLNALEMVFDIDGHTDATYYETIVNFRTACPQEIDFDLIKGYLDMEIGDEHIFPIDHTDENSQQITATRIK